MWDECKGTGLRCHPHGPRWRLGNNGRVILPRLQDLWDPLAQPALTSPFAHHCMQRLKSATPCRTAERHGFEATLGFLAGEGVPRLAHSQGRAAVGDARD
jgi:hypothetical protein